MPNTFDQLGIDIRLRAGEQKVFCPQCHHQRKDKSDKSLSVNLKQGENGFEGAFNCHYCAFKGFATQYPVEKKMEPAKTYKRPTERQSVLSEGTLAWFAGRGISAPTLERYRVSESKEKMPAKSSGGIQYEEGERHVICFNYYRDGQLINIKFRDKIKSFKMVYGAELIFYGLDYVKDSQTVVITEGEIDALSCYESGIYHAISVPNGASKGSQKLDYLDNCWKAFENKTKIILATDGDEAGQSLCHELARRLGKERCWTITYPEGCKDTNEVLLRYGADDVRKMYQNAQQWPLEGVESESEVEAGMDDVWNNDFPIGDDLGYKHLDTLIRWRSGEKGGQIVIVTGESNSGKSAFIDQCIVRLASRHGWKFAIFSFEQQPTRLHQSNLATVYIGLSMRKTAYRRMNQWQFEQAKDFVKSHFFFVKLGEADISIEGIIAKSEELVLRKGIRGVVVDPWNEIEHRIPKGVTETNYVSEALTKVRRLKDAKGICFIQIAHPRKAEFDKKTGKLKVTTLNDISGSGNFKNKADIGISVYRDFQPRVPGESFVPDPIFVHIPKVRWEFDGHQGVSEFKFNLDCKRYTEVGDRPEPILMPPDSPPEPEEDQGAGWHMPHQFAPSVQAEALNKWNAPPPTNFHEVDRNEDPFDVPF